LKVCHIIAAAKNDGGDMVNDIIHSHRLFADSAPPLLSFQQTAYVWPCMRSRERPESSASIPVVGTLFLYIVLAPFGSIPPRPLWIRRPMLGHIASALGGVVGNPRPVIFLRTRLANCRNATLFGRVSIELSRRQLGAAFATALEFH
jgi:hypothetical protein